MLRCALPLFIALCFSGNAFAKCIPTDFSRVAWTRKIIEKTLPKGVEVYDRAWLKNPTPTEFITYTLEKGAAERTGYREILGNVPTTKDELPGTKLVNDERYEYSYPANPTYPDGQHAVQVGWLKQDYSAGLIATKTPVMPAPIEERVFSGKLKIFLMKSSVLYYYGKKRGVIDIVYEFKRNPRFGVVDTNCPSPTPSAIPTEN